MGYAVKLQARSDDEWKLLWTSPYKDNKNSGSSGSRLYPDGTQLTMPVEILKYQLLMITCVGRLYNNNYTMEGAYKAGIYFNTLLKCPLLQGLNTTFICFAPVAYSATSYSYFGRRRFYWLFTPSGSTTYLVHGAAITYNDGTWPLYIYGISKNKQKNIENAEPFYQYTPHD